MTKRNIPDLVRRDTDSENAELRRRLIEGYSQLAAGNFREVSADELFNKAMDQLRAEGMEIGDEEYIRDLVRRDMEAEQLANIRTAEDDIAAGRTRPLGTKAEFMAELETNYLASKNRQS